MRKLRLLLACLLVASIGLVNAQTRTASGTVVSAEDGQPIVGASVVVKGTTTGTSTNVDGKFSLNVPNNASMLVVSYVGMKQMEVKIGANLMITMSPDEKTFEEVVVVGYGSAKKLGTQVGSVVNVSAKAIQDKPVANVMDALQGKVSGMTVLTSSGEPSAVASIRIRGTGSLTAGNDPLYVLDGVPIEPGTIRTLNPNDFETVTVLKDASATSIYGSRAANGVIYITTKKGKVDQDATITLNAYYGVSSLANMSFFKPMNSKELLDYQLKHSAISKAFYDARIADGYDTKWTDFYFDKNVPTYNADLSIRGGNGRTIYYVSGNYFDQKGTSPSSWYKKYSGRVNLESQLKSWLRMGVNLSGGYDKSSTTGYTYQASSSPNGGIFASILAQPYYSPIDPKTGQAYWDTPIPGWNRYNPRYLNEMQPGIVNNVQLNGSAFLQITPVEGLTLKSLIGIDAYDYRRSFKMYPSYKNAKGAGDVSERFRRNATKTITNTAEYKYTLNNSNNFVFLIGQESIVNAYENFQARTTKQSDDRLMLLTAGPTNENPQHDKSEYAYNSYFGRIDYNYGEKYFANFTVRNDASSRFGKNNRSATFYSGGLMWNAKKEGFVEDISWIDDLKIKASIGSTGNSQIGNYESQALVATNKYDAATGWTLSNPGNPDLGWETQILSNVGFALDMFKVVRLDFSVYNRSTINMLMEVPVPYTTGFSTITQNVGSMRNYGLDIDLGVDIVKTKDFYLGFHTTFNYNQNKVTKLFYGIEDWPMPDYLFGYVVGKSVNFYMPINKGVDPQDGKQMWEIPNSDGKTTKIFDANELNQRTDKPYIIPVTGGFSFTSTYKGIGLQADFAYVYNKWLVNNDKYFSHNSSFVKSGSNGSADLLKEWEKPGDITDIPAFGEKIQFDTHLLENASFLRLKNLTLSYELPKAVLRRVNLFNGVRLYATGRNLFTITKYTGADPEIDSNLTYGAYPNSKQYTFGFQITF